MVKRKPSKISMPMSGAGLIRYMDEEGKGIKFRPEHILFVALGVVLIELLVKMGVI